MDTNQIREKYNELVDIYHDSEEEKSNQKQMLLALKDEEVMKKIKELVKPEKLDILNRVFAEDVRFDPLFLIRFAHKETKSSARH